MAESNELEEGEIQDDVEIMKVVSHMKPSFKNRRKYSSSWGQTSFQPRVIQNKNISKRTVFIGKKNENTTFRHIQPCLSVRDKASEKKGCFDDMFNHNGLESGYDLDDYELLLIRHELIQQQLKKLTTDDEPMIVLSEYEAEAEKLFEEAHVKKSLEDDISLGKDVILLSDSSQNDDNDEELELLRNILLSQAKKKNKSLQKKSSVELTNDILQNEVLPTEVTEDLERTSKLNCLIDSSEKPTEVLDHLIKSSDPNGEIKIPCLTPCLAFQSSKEKSLKKFRQRRAENKIRKEKKKIKRFDKMQTRSQTAAAERELKDPSSQIRLKVQVKRRKKKRGGKRSRFLAIRALHKGELKKCLHDQKEVSKEDDYNNVPMEIDDEPSAYIDGFAPLPLIETTEVPPPLPTAPPSPLDSTFKPTVDIVPQYMTSSNVSWMPGYVENLYCDSESSATDDKSNLKDEDKEEKIDFPDKVDEDEVWALRAQALKSLACKRAAKVKKMHKVVLQEKNFKSDIDQKVNLNPNPKVISVSNVVGLTNVDFKKFMPPKHAPVVIQLSKEDFESDDDSEQNISVKTCKNSELDQLFQQARTESKKRTSSIAKSSDELLIKNVKTCIEKSVAKMKKHSSSIVKDQLAYKKLQKVINEKRSSFTTINDSVKQLQDKLQAAIQERNRTKKIHNDLHAQFKVVKERLKEKIAIRNSVDENILKAKSIISSATEDSVILNDKMKQNVESLMNTLTYFISQGDLPKQTNYAAKEYTSKFLTPTTHTSVVTSTNEKALPNTKNKMDLKKLELLLRKKLDTHHQKNVLETSIPKENKSLMLVDYINQNKSNKDPHKSTHKVFEQSISIKALPNIKSMADLKTLQEKILHCTAEPPINNIALFDNLIDLLEYNSFIAPPEVVPITSKCSASSESGLKKFRSNLSDSKYGSFELFSKYNSVLTNFKSYRLSPYFRTQSKYSLQSATFSNQINPYQVMCKYEVFGTCNDKLCTCWHFKDKCSLDQINLVKDLVSYEPSMFDADKVASNEKKQYLLSMFTKKFLSQYSGKISSEEQLLILWNQIRQFRRSKKEASFESISFNCRSWFIDQNVKSPDIHAHHHYLKSYKPVYFLKKKSTNSQNMQSECQEVRYFSESYNSSEMLETAITKDPGSVKLWLSLAKLRLQQGKPDDIENKLSNREHALSVLSNSLEENRDSEELWIEYLNLVAKNTTSEELRELCYQAVMYAGTYNVWWTCLNLECTYLGKQEICTEMITFIYDNNETIENFSHCLLETVLYAAQLLISRNKTKLAVGYLASALGRESFDNSSEKLYLEDITLKLDIEDKALLWICYISVKVFNELPKNLYLSEQSDSGRLVNKNKFVLNWKYKTFAICNEEIRNIFNDAIKSFGSDFLKPSFILHENMVAFEISVDQQRRATQILCSIVKEEPCFVEGWVLLLSIHIKHSPTDIIVKLAEEALHRCNHDAEIVYFYSSWLYKENFPKLALEKLTKCVHMYFELANDGEDLPDVLYLYQKILGLTIPYSVILPTYISKISEHLIFYCWMCYCLVLKIKNVSPTLHIFSTAVDEAFECAVHRYTSRQNTKKLWLAYIKHKLCFLNSSHESNDKFLDLLYRCLASVAASEVAVHSIHWKDYSFHNKLLDLCLPYINLDAHAQFFQKTLQLMPDNVYHALRVSQFEFDQKNYNQARFICGAVLDDFPKFLPLWRMAIQIELKCDNIQEARWLFGEAIKSLPFISLLWKEYLKFEITNAKDSDKLNDVLDTILSKCKENGIYLVDESCDENLFSFFVT
ncbi:zinc finger C3H1 domain-containing protein isoform X3 [Hydra vulgaris]|uniref:Zinc finger C3H1 domain-containing protein isoform X3 n=1 Tax=Hydra vulgaris TaxID=6087 RepID=A0ABM4D801_HYDVU